MVSSRMNEKSQKDKGQSKEKFFYSRTNLILQFSYKIRKNPNKNKLMKKIYRFSACSKNFSQGIVPTGPVQLDKRVYRVCIIPDTPETRDPGRGKFSKVIHRIHVHSATKDQRRPAVKIS